MEEKTDHQSSSERLAGDESIYQEACKRLTHHGQLDASGIAIEVAGGQITLRGQVPGQSGIKMAEEALRTIPGMQAIHNQIMVGSTPSSTHSDPSARSEVTETKSADRE